MGRPERELDRDGSPEREFAFWLRDLRRRSELTYQRMARITRYATSTLQEAAAGRRLPSLKVTLAFVAACGGDQAAWRQYWAEVRRALDTGSPAGARGPIAPPGAGTEELAVDQPGPGAGDTADGWYVESFSALLRMDVPEPEAVEHRVIVATIAGVSELATSISVPRHPDDGSPEHKLDAELLFGGSLELRHQPYESYFRHVIALPRPLLAGERHDYQLRLRVPPGQQMAPHYVYVPLGRSDRFELRIRFARDRLPQAVWILSGVPTAVIYERGETGAALAPDRFGEVHAEFRDLRVGHGYGIRWQE